MRFFREGSRLLSIAYPSSSFPRQRLATMATSATSDWEATRYLNFESERTRPARDLLAQVHLTSPSRIVDLGCGPGNSTALLAARYPSAKLTGIDSSPNMLEQARKVLPDASFELGDLRTYTPTGQVDLFYSNAVFQWLKADERGSAIKILLEFQPEGGVLAIQVPDNLDEPSHVAMRETAAQATFREVYGARTPARDTFPSPIMLYDELKPLCTKVDIWHTYYQHRLADAEAIVDWVQTTGLRPYLEPLNEEQKEHFLKDYLGRIQREYPPLDRGENGACPCKYEIARGFFS
jgi:trans-aconitate 2-methyltransferase